MSAPSLSISKGETDMGYFHDVPLEEDARAKKLASELEQELSSLELQMKDLASRYAAAAAKLSECRIIVSPQKRIPAEILSKIFESTLPEGRIVCPPKRWNDFPWVLRSVCSRWRQVALNTPRLWNNLMLRINRGAPPQLFSYTASVLPKLGILSISLIADCHASSVMAFEAIIVPNLPRLQHLSLEIPACSLVSLLDDRFQDLACLRSVELKVDWVWATAFDVWNRHVALPWPLEDYLRKIWNAKNLERIKLESSQIPISNAFYNSLSSEVLPMEQLVDIDISITQDIFPIVKILQRCSCLERFSARVKLSTSLDDDEIPGMKFHLPHLRFVSLNGVGHRINPIVAKIQLPWDQFTYLSLDPVNFTMAYDILRQCKGLEELVVSIRGTEPELGIPSEDIQLPNLALLSIKTRYTRIFGCLVVPKLDNLNVESLQIIFPTEELSHMLSRSQCALSALSLSAERYDKEGFSDLLNHLQSVTTFIIEGFKLSEETLMKIGQLPYLATFECGPASPVGFVKLIKERLKPDSPRAPLRRALCDFRNKYYHKEPIIYLQKLAQELIDLSRIHNADYKLDITSQGVAYSSDTESEDEIWPV